MILIHTISLYDSRTYRSYFNVYSELYKNDDQLSIYISLKHLRI